jgi:hypothetical protein
MLPRPLLGEDYLSALLLRLVLEHCRTMNSGELDSFEIEANADAMRESWDAALARRLYDAGATYKAIGERVGAEPQLVSQFAARHWPKRDKPMAYRPGRPQAQVAQAKAASARAPDAAAAALAADGLGGHPE